MKFLYLDIVLCILLIFSACSPQTITTPTNTPEPTKTSEPTVLPSKTPTPNHPLGRIVYYKSSEPSEYNYFSYIPRTLSKDNKVYIVVGPDYGQCSECCDVDGAANNVNYFMQEYLHYADSYGFVLLFPAISNNCDGKRDQWTLHFPNYVFTDPTGSPFYRPDLKINSSIDSLLEILNKDGYDVNKRVFIFGFSIGGLAANRYTLLQPDRVEAFAAGGTAGDICMPVDNIGGVKLNWAFGINDFEKLVGKSFNKVTYLKIPQLYFLGDEDLGNYHLKEICNAGTNAACHWASYWGNDLVTAFRNQCAYLKELGMDVICQEYLGIKHEFTSKMKDDVFNYFNKIREKQ